MRILFVCLGNICRSPAAEGVFRRLSEQAGLSLHIESAGTGGYHVGELPDRRMRSTAKQRGYDLSSHAQKFAKAHFDSFDWILTMDDDNYNNVVRIARDADDEAKVERFVRYVSMPNVKEVPDPYYGGPEGFDLVIDILENGCSAMIEELQARS